MMKIIFTLTPIIEFIMQLLGILIYLLGFGGVIFSLATMKGVNYLLLLASVVIYLLGAIILSYPTRKTTVFIALIILPITFFGCMYLLDIGYKYGLGLPHFLGVLLSIIVSAIISFLVMKYGST